MEAPQAGWMCAKAGEMKNSRKKRLLLWAGGAVLFFGVLCFGLIQYRVYSLSAPYRVAEEEAPEAQAIVILGAKVEEDGTLSPALEDRLAQGLALYRAGKAGFYKVFLLCLRMNKNQIRVAAFCVRDGFACPC